MMRDVMIRYFILLAFLSVAIGAALLSWGISQSGAPAQAAGPGSIVADATEKTFLDVATGVQISVPFNLRNGTECTVHIVGATTICDRNGCLAPEDASKLPMEILPGETQTLYLAVKAGDPGFFSQQAVLFTDCKQSLKIVVRVSGLVVPAEPGS
jgi:hypothetical protein